jgi:hypothetical protein
MTTFNVPDAVRRAKELRKHHKPTEIPPCPVCGRRLTIGSCGGGEPTIYACGLWEADPDKPGTSRRRTNYESYGCTWAEHYGRSRFTDRRHADPDVPALCDDVDALVALARELAEAMLIQFGEGGGYREIIAVAREVGLLEEVVGEQ